MTKVKIVSGWTDPGGSTISFINLCNLFNTNGHDCVLYGPHEWHLDQCKGSLHHLSMLQGNPGEILLTHFVELKERPQGFDKVILTCHEKESWKVKDNPVHWDEIVYVSESQRDWQGVYGRVIPNVIENLDFFDWSSQKETTAVGIIGGIEPNKQTHLSIERALADGHTNILIFGVIHSEEYYETKIKHYVDSGKVFMMGFEKNKQFMYNQVEKVYHSSKSETFNLVKAECEMLTLDFDSLPSANSGADYGMSNAAILKEWEKCFKIIQE